MITRTRPMLRCTYIVLLSTNGILSVTHDTYSLKCGDAGKTWLKVLVAYFKVGPTVPTVTSSMELGNLE